MVKKKQVSGYLQTWTLWKVEEVQGRNVRGVKVASRLESDAHRHLYSRHHGGAGACTHDGGSLDPLGSQYQRRIVKQGSVSSQCERNPSALWGNSHRRDQDH